MKKDILEMGKAELLSLNPYDFALRPLSAKKVIHIAEALGAFWRYDYEAAKAGKPGKHAILKSGLHSDGFLISKILLEPENIRSLMALQILERFSQFIVPWPDYIVGVPDGATELAKCLGDMMSIAVAEMKKDKSTGRITVITRLERGLNSILIVEDICTKGTGFKETVSEIECQSPVNIMPYEMVIVNRGGLKEITVDKVGTFKIISVADYRINEWEPEQCRLCRDYGSVAIKPKVSEESWRDITTSQKM